MPWIVGNLLITVAIRYLVMLRPTLIVRSAQHRLRLGNRFFIDCLDLSELLAIAELLLLILDEAVVGEIGIHSAAFVLEGLDRGGKVDLALEELLR